MYGAIPCTGMVFPEITQISLSASATRCRNWSGFASALVKRARWGGTRLLFGMSVAEGFGKVDTLAANWSVRNDVRPVPSSCVIAGGVGPNVDCSRKRTAAEAV